MSAHFSAGRRVRSLQQRPLELQRLENRHAPSGVNALVSRAEPTLYGDSANGSSWIEIDPNSVGSRGHNISADGRYVAFQSNATNVVAGQVDNNNAYDVFLYDRVANTTVLVSGANGSPAVTANGHDDLTNYSPNASAQAISADGRYVTYVSNATNIVLGFVPAVSTPANIYVYDRLTAQTKLVSHAAGSPITSASAICTVPDISGNGQVITFTTNAVNLVAGFPNPGGSATSKYSHAYAYDVSTSQVTLIDHKYGSVSDPGTGIGSVNGMTPNGRYIVLNSFAPDLLSVISTSKGDAYRYDRQSGVLELISRGSNVAPFGGNSKTGGTAISDDGNWVCMVTQATNLVPGTTTSGVQVLLSDVATGQIRLVTHVPGNLLTGGNNTSTGAFMSADGKYVAFISLATNLVSGFIDGNSTSTYDVFTYDRTTAEVTLVNHSVGSLNTSGNGASDTFSLPKISGDGNYIMFADKSTDLVSGFVDRNGSFYHDVYRYDRLNGTVSLISGQNNSATFSGNGHSFYGAMSADGKVVAIASDASDLSSTILDANDNLDVYVKDLTNGSTALASRRAGTPSLSAGGFALESLLQTPDGRYVVFTDSATNLVLGQVDQYPSHRYASSTLDVFLLDRLTNTMTLVSHAAGTTAAGANGDCIAAAISADGRFVAYSSIATNLITGFIDSNGPPSVGDGQNNTDVFLFDRVTGQNVLVSHLVGTAAVGGNRTSGGLGGSFINISDDGRWIVFQSDATDLMADAIGGNGLAQVYLYDRTTAAISLVSHIPGAPGTAVNSTNSPRSMSADGRFIAYWTNASNIVTGMTGGGGRNVILYDRLADTNVLVSHAAGSMTASSNAGSNNPYISRDGNYIAYQSAATNLIAGGVDGNSYDDVFLYDRATGTNTLVSHTFNTTTQAGNFTSFDCLINADGRYITYISEAQNLISSFVDGNVNTQTGNGRDIWLYDRVTNTNTLVSRSAASPLISGNDSSYMTSISGDGRFVGYVSRAMDIVSGFTDPGSNFSANLYLFDRVLGTNVLVTHDVNNNTASGNNYPRYVTINQDGSVVAYASEASNLVGGDLNGFEDVFAYVQRPPTVLSVQVNDGSAQRSLVKSVVVTFSEPVSFSGSVASAFTVRRTGTGGTVGDVTLSATPVSGPTSSVTLTFSGSLTEYGSLVDGLYDLWINPAQVSGTFGLLDGNNDGVAGGSYHLVGSTANGFYRLFGDSNGDGTVSQGQDFAAFRLAFLTGPSLVFDFDGDGQVGQLDFNAFRLRFMSTP